MKIESVKIENFKGIESMGVDLGGKSVYVVGGNAAGKTSFISAIYCALTGKNLPPNPIKGDAETGRIEVGLEGYTVELDFKRNADGQAERKLSLVSDKDGKLASPRTRIDALIGTLEFDPFAFMRMSPTPQLNYFCKVFGVDGVGRLNDNIATQNTFITQSNRDLISLKGEVGEDTGRADEKLEDVSELSEAYQKAVDAQAKINKSLERREALQMMTAELKRQMVDLEAETAENDLTIELNSISPPDIEAARARLASSSDTNEAITQARRQRDLLKEIEGVKVKIAGLLGEKTAMAAEKRALISQHTEKIQGFEYDEERGFILDGLPFHVDQTNTSAQIVAGLKLGAGLLGDVKIARFDGSLLDNENLAVVNEFAEKEGLQLFVELVDREEKELRIEFVEAPAP
tara:strand:+ start:595 stop:1806 length:1212 start_codon:yes stop_codon:yes gene_type:complete